MVYQFQCPNGCGYREIHCAIAERDDNVYCPRCAGQMRRMIARPHLITRRTIDEPENKYAFGFDQGSRMEFMRENERLNREVDNGPRHRLVTETEDEFGQRQDRARAMKGMGEKSLDEVSKPNMVEAFKQAGLI